MKPNEFFVGFEKFERFSCEERDFYLELIARPENKVCFDCQAKEAYVASFAYGVFVCYACSSLHVLLGHPLGFSGYPHSYLRWSHKGFQIMSCGGNVRAKAFFKEKGWTDGGENLEETRKKMGSGINWFEKKMTEIKEKYKSTAVESYRKLIYEDVVERNEQEIRLPSPPPRASSEPGKVLGKNEQEEMGLPRQEEDTDEARKRFPDAKSISSTQYFWDADKLNNLEAPKNLQEFLTATAISSNDLLGHTNTTNSHVPIWKKLLHQANEIASALPRTKF